MSESEFLKVKPLIGQVVLIHLKTGGVLCGAYKGNFEVSQGLFDIENHKTNRIEKVQLESILQFVI